MWKLMMVAVLATACSKSEQAPKAKEQPATVPSAECDKTSAVRHNWITRMDVKWGYGDGSEYSPSQRGGFEASGPCNTVITMRMLACNSSEIDRNDPYLAEAAAIGFTTIGCITANLDGDSKLAATWAILSIVKPAIYVDKPTKKKRK